MNRPFVPADEIRTIFSEAMSQMYRTEVPLYGDLIEIVDRVNRRTLSENPALEARLRARGELDRLGCERHGAIRLGTAAELATMCRAFAVMGMYPVGYYDLSPAGVPVHSTAFRPVDPDSLRNNPFRVFTSLLRLGLIADEALREQAGAILAGRQIFSQAALRLIDRQESDGGLDANDANRFVQEMLDTFRWHGTALVEAETYQQLLGAHRLVADVVSFRGPHLNHLTPRTLDIDAVQSEMHRMGIAAKDVIEGPPRRKVPILLRQTSFKALSETIRFSEGRTPGKHTARFGEIEQRGCALTEKGRALYDNLLIDARNDTSGLPYRDRLARAFADFPDDEEVLRKQGLAFFRYEATRARQVGADADLTEGNLDELIATGALRAEPLTYEDFLPVSAAGIFQSNLGEGEQREYSANAAKAEFERDLGREVISEFDLYAGIERLSIQHAMAELQATLERTG